jgi:RNA polymerase sigma factor for flagellar operon FliA
VTSKTQDMAAQPLDTNTQLLQPEDSSSHLKAVALRTYAEQKPQRMSDDEITQFLPMVNSIARKATSYLRPPLSFEDLVSAGTIGLVKAARDFDASHGAKFKTYAYIRIRGAILDELRSTSMLPSNLNRQVRAAMELHQRITSERGVPPTDEELANRLDITIEELYSLYENSRANKFVSLDASEPEGNTLAGALACPITTGPDAQLEQAELIEELSGAISQLDEKRRQIIILYYQQHLTMKQIAETLDITESRISQLHASAIFNLSAKLRNWKDGW